jgi:hypothetical protein
MFNRKERQEVVRKGRKKDAKSERKGAASALKSLFIKRLCFSF